MGIHRTNYFAAKTGQGDLLAQQFKVLLPKISSLEGCISCELFQSTDNPDVILILENWTSTDAHVKASQNISAADFQHIIGLLDGKPQGAYFKQVS